MDLKVDIHLVFLCTLNLIFFFSGVILNTLVIITILKSVQLRKKLCHFMIMLLSCCDLLTVMTTNAMLLFYLIIWFTENYDLLISFKHYWHLSTLPGSFSLLVLLVMCIERYLGAYYPFFHRISVTRRRLLIFLLILVLLPTTLIVISTNHLAFSYSVAFAIFMVVFLPPFMFFNFKLLKMSRKMRRKNATTPETKMKITFKNVNTCLLVVGCLVFFTITVTFYVVFSLVQGKTNNTSLCSIWIGTIQIMNCTFNCLIFFWKNKVLRAEGVKILKKIKM